MTKHRLALLLVAIAVTVGFAHTRRVADADAGTRTFEVTGVVTAPPAGGQVVVAHGDIPGYMPAMTMPFRLASGAPALGPGDRVRFTLRVAAEWSRAEDLAVVGHDATVAATARPEPTGPPRLKKGGTVPPFSLTTQDGRTFTDADLRGRLTAVTFIFTRCPVPEFCPLTVKRFQQLQRETARDRTLGDVQLVSVTLDPAFDTPPVLQAYAEAMRVDPTRWRFVTGDPAQVGRLASAFSIHTERNGALLDHTLATAIVGADGRIVDIWRGTGWAVSDLLAVLRREPHRSPGHQHPPAIAP
jgi:protein SCO1/2